MQAALQRQFIQIQAALRVYNKFDREIAMVKIVRHHFHKFVRITFTSIAKHGFRWTKPWVLKNQQSLVCKRPKAKMQQQLQQL